MQILSGLVPLATVEDCDVSEILISTPWNGEDKTLILEKRNVVAKAFSVQSCLEEKSTVVTNTGHSQCQADELDSYEALVREAGY